MTPSKSLWFLRVFFAWTAARGVGYLLDAETVTDYGLLASVGAGSAFYAVMTMLVVGEGATAILLSLRRAAAFPVGILTLLLDSISTLVTSTIVALHPDTAVSLYMASRTARGMSERSEADLAFMMSPPVLWSLTFAIMAWFAVIVILLRRVRPELTGSS